MRKWQRVSVLWNQRNSFFWGGGSTQDELVWPAHFTVLGMTSRNQGSRQIPLSKGYQKLACFSALGREAFTLVCFGGGSGYC